MAVNLTPLITGTPGQPPSYNIGMAETFSWVPIDTDAGRPLFARAGYIVNLKDLSISLSASDINIGGVELSDGENHAIRGTIQQLGSGKGNALQIVEMKPVSAVLISGTAAVSGSMTITNPTTGVRVLNTVAVSGSVTMTNPTTGVNILNTVAVSGSMTATVDATKGFPVTIADTGHLDAFSRLRVSTPYTLFDSKTLHNKSSLFWSQTAIGTGAVNFTGNGDSSVTLSAAAIGDYAIRQTNQRFNYQPGKSQLCVFTGLMTPTSNTTKRYGLFTSLTAVPFTPNVGLYFETQTDSASSIAVVQNNGNNLVPSVSARREDWNIDRLDGTGISGKTLNLSAANIFLIDFEWLGVGRVRYGAVIDGVICYCHEINNAGNVQGAYIITPNLPVRAEVRQVGAGTASMKMICCSVMSEGGADFTGAVKSVDTGYDATGIRVTTAGNRRALIGVRLQAHKLDSVNEILNASVLPLPHSSATVTPYRYELLHNPTLGGSAVTWSANPNSNFEYAVAPDNTISITDEGTVIASGYATVGQTIDLSGYRFEKFLRMGCSVNGSRDQLWIVVTPIINATADGFHASITFIESD